MGLLSLSWKLHCLLPPAPSRCRAPPPTLGECPASRAACAGLEPDFKKLINKILNKCMFLRLLAIFGII
jgi:hypothetical protein